MRSFLLVAAIAFSVSGLALDKTDRSKRIHGENHKMQIYYLEIVTNDVDATCAVYTAANGLQFGDPDSALGNARTAVLSDGSMVGVRAPMRESEEPVIRPYWLVDDIESAVAAAVDAGAQLALPPMEIPGYGTCAIYIEGGVQHGLWQQ